MELTDMIYTGIGARKTPKEFLGKMRSVGRFMAQWGHTLRSGGAPGADSAFEGGCIEKEGKMDIYLPWEYFNHNHSRLFGATKDARMMASVFHPNWSNVGPAGRDFMGRNCYQILGRDLKTPTDFVICWTPGGKFEGGTGQALRMADHYHIPILNMGCVPLDEIEETIMELILPEGETK